MLCIKKTSGLYRLYVVIKKNHFAYHISGALEFCIYSGWGGGGGGGGGNAILTTYNISKKGAKV